MQVLGVFFYGMLSFYMLFSAGMATQNLPVVLLTIAGSGAAYFAEFLNHVLIDLDDKHVNRTVKLQHAAVYTSMLCGVTAFLVLTIKGF